MAFPQLATLNGEFVEDDGIEIPTDDGGVIVRLNGAELGDDGDGEPEGDPDFYANLALTMDEGDLAAIGEELIDAVENHDIPSRRVWMGNYEKGMGLLGLEQKTPSGEATEGGVSKIDHPLLLETCILAQSNESAELLPSGGPVKIDNEGHETAITDRLAMQLEKDFNEYLMVHRPEYYADSERMIWERVFGGIGFKKIYHCPIRRAVVSDRVSPPDLIVSNQATSLYNAGRITHRIKIRPALMRRMMHVEAYRDVDLETPAENLNNVERKTASISGINPSSTRQEDVDYTVYEICCELDMPGDEHKENGKATGLPRPYIVTVERDTRQVLEVRRNWVEHDELFTMRRRYVDFPFLPMFGFYASGLVSVLGNTTTALTAAWRMMLDAGMFANFPGGAYLKKGDRQLANNFRALPGQFAPIDAGGADDIRKVMMAYPYKEPGPATQTFIQHISETGSRVGGAAMIPVAEGKADAPVGTTLAMLEQAAKMIGATHRRAHQAQSLEFQIMLELIREAPEDFIKFFKRDGFWTEELLMQALEQYNLVPKADPNTPSQMHRIIKAMGLKQLEQLAPDRYDGRKVDEHVMRVGLGIEDPEEFFAPPAQPGAMPPDPTLAVAQMVAQTEQAKVQQKEMADQRNAQLKAGDLQIKAAALVQKERENQAKLRSVEDVTVFKEQATTEREMMKLDAQAHQHQSDQEMAAYEAQAGRDHTSAESKLDRDQQSREGAEGRRNSVQLAKMKPKPGKT